MINDTNSPNKIKGFKKITTQGIATILMIVALFLLSTTSISFALDELDTTIEDKSRQIKDEFVQGELLIETQKSTNLDNNELKSLTSLTDLKLTNEFDNYYKLESKSFIGSKSSINKHIEQIKKAKNVVNVEYNELMEPTAVINKSFPAVSNTKDPLKARQYYLKNSSTASINIETESAKIKAFSTKPVLVAVLDAGFTLTNPDLADVWAKDVRGKSMNYDAVLGGSNVSHPGVNNAHRTVTDHGTGVSSVIAAKEGKYYGFAGICQNCKIIPIKVSSNDSTLVNTMAVIKGIDYAIYRKAEVINLSFRSYSPNNLLRDKINQALLKGISIVAGAGNDGSNNDIKPSYPASYRDVIAVSAYDRKGVVAGYSNYGQNVDVGAPGSGVPIAMDNRFITGSGTSYSTPLVTGFVGIIKSKFPNLTPKQINELIVITKQSNGIFDVKKALEYDVTKLGKMTSVTPAVDPDKITKIKADNKEQLVYTKYFINTYNGQPLDSITVKSLTKGLTVTKQPESDKDLTKSQNNFGFGTGMKVDPLVLKSGQNVDYEVTIVYKEGTIVKTVVNKFYTTVI
jgi:subtilisin family serine protease